MEISVRISRKVIAAFALALFVTAPVVRAATLDAETRWLLGKVPQSASAKVDVSSFSALAECPDEQPFDDCFGTHSFVAGEGGDASALVTRIGYWVNNSVWYGFEFKNHEYTAYYDEGEYVAPRCSRQGAGLWYVCPDESRMRPMTGYLDAAGDLQGKWVVEYREDRTYEGNFVDDQKNGFGILTEPHGGGYSGHWKDDMRHGEGSDVSAEGGRYVGSYRFDLRHGFGTYVWASGVRYEGEWTDGKVTGYGTTIFTDGSYYTGQHVDGKRDGQGTFFWTSGSKYDGEWVSGEMTGEGTMTYNDGTTRSGVWDDGNYVGASPARKQLSEPSSAKPNS